MRTRCGRGRLQGSPQQDRIVLSWTAWLCFDGVLRGHFDTPHLLYDLSEAIKSPGRQTTVVVSKRLIVNLADPTLTIREQCYYSLAVLVAYTSSAGIVCRNFRHVTDSS